MPMQLPMTFEEAQAAEIVDTLAQMWDRGAELTTSEGARRAMQRNLSAHLHAGEVATVPLAHIIAMADHGHEPAQWALNEFIATRIDQKRFDELTPGLQDYNKRVLLKHELPGYGRGHKIIDTWTRDAVIAFLVRFTIEHWRLKKKRAAHFVALVLKRRGVVPNSTRQVLEIYDNRDTLGHRLVTFMMTAVPNESAN
jgi:hypothetical protein